VGLGGEGQEEFQKRKKKLTYTEKLLVFKNVKSKEEPEF
jgi:hypothetical protein